MAFVNFKKKKEVKELTELLIQYEKKYKKIDRDIIFAKVFTDGYVKDEKDEPYFASGIEQHFDIVY